MTITLAAVYAPIGFVSGLTGTLFREFAFTLAGAVIVSGVIALTLSPMMCSKLLRSQTGKGGGLVGLLDRRFESLKGRYQRRLHRTLNYRPVTILVLVGLIAGSVLMYTTAQKELAPEEDQGILFNFVKTPQYANLDYLEQATQQLYKAYSTVPEKEHVFTINGMGDVHQAFAGILFKPWSERTRKQKADPAGAVAAHLEHADGTRAVLLAAVAAGIDRRAAGAVRHHHHARLPAAGAGARRCPEGGEGERPVHLLPTPISGSRRRRSSSRSTTTRPTGSASPWRTSATRWRRCSAATTSIGSTSTAAAIR